MPPRLRAHSSRAPWSSASASPPRMSAGRRARFRRSSSAWACGCAGGSTASTSVRTARRLCTTTRRAAPRPPRSGSGRASCRWPCTCARSSSSWASPPPAASTSRCPAPTFAPAAGPVLTDEQEHPVARRAEPLLLSAGAGSGKTSVLVERFVRAVGEDGVAPGRILAITFTDRAAGELRERVRARFLELGEREAARDTEAAFVGTFHGFCARLLRAHPLLAELDPDFAILDEGMAGRLRGRAFSTALRLFLGRGDRAGAVDLLGAYGVDRVHTMIAAVHAQLRSRGQRVPSLPEPIVIEGATDADQNAEAAAACALLDELLGGFSCAYEELKRERSAVDFDDLELFARDLLERHETVRAAWAERFELLMVDEFQDTNPRQLAILRALERGNLFTVGDEFQSIYGFRHADVSLFRARRQ